MSFLLIPVSSAIFVIFLSQPLIEDPLTFNFASNTIFFVSAFLFISLPFICSSKSWAETLPISNVGCSTRDR